MASDLQPDGPHELEHLLDDGVGHLGFVDDVPNERLRLRDVADPAPQEPRHHFDAAERVLDLVGDHGRHLAHRGEPIPQALALLELLDPREVLEEHGRADHPVVVVPHQRDGVPDDPPRRPQP